MSALLNEAIKNFDIFDYVQTHGGSEIQNNEWVLTCPRCGKEKLIVNIPKGTWHCWICETYGPPDYRGHRRTLSGGGGVVALVAWMESLEGRDAAERVIALARFTPEDLTQIKPEELRTGFLDAEKTQAEAIEPPAHLRQIGGILPYMVRRGITLEDARSFGLGWCDGGRYANRLVFPVWENRRFVYFQARAMWEQAEHVPRWPEDRYVKALNPGRADGASVSSDLLMNLDIARAYPRVAITEGPIDCVKTGSSAVCTFGKKISPTQIAKLLRAGVRALDLIWDGPSEREPDGAWPEMLAVAPVLSALFDLRLVRLPHGDPGDHPREYLDWLRASAQPAQSQSRLTYV